MGIEKFKESGSSIDNFLNMTMEFLNSCSEAQLSEIEAGFEISMDCAYDIFGKYAFRRISSIPPAKRNPINVALFESWSVGLSELSSWQRKKIIEKKETLWKYFVDALQNHSYSSDINTAKYNSVKRRFEIVDKIISEVLEK